MSVQVSFTTYTLVLNFLLMDTKSHYWVPQWGFYVYDAAHITFFFISKKKKSFHFHPYPFSRLKGRLRDDV